MELNWVGKMGHSKRIIYVSTTRGAIGRGDVEHLTNWSPDDVSGNVILYDGKNLIQALQGDPTRTRARFDRIAADPRHFNVCLLTEQEVSPEDSLGADLLYLINTDGINKTTVSRKYLMLLIKMLKGQPSSDGGTLMDVLSGFLENK
ncbi:MAG: hypothetical protein ACI9QL_002506 [Candidatus Omnitrophota bacterium]